MKRLVTLILAAGLIIAGLGAPASALGILLPTPADGNSVSLNTWGGVVYEYPADSSWYFDGGVGNQSGSTYAAGVNIVNPMVTIEFLDASDTPIGTETFSAGANVMPYYLGAGLPTGYFKWVHHKLEGLPAGAVLSKTRFRAEVSNVDPEWPKYQYGTAASAIAYQGLPSVASPWDFSLGDGRVQCDLTVTNNTSSYVGPVRVWGNEDYGLTTSNAYMLNAYDVTALDAAKSQRLAPGESTVFHLRGLAATPIGQNRYSDWNREVEAEALTNVTGTITSGANPVGGATVSVSECTTTTAADGTYTLQGVVPGARSVTIAKAAFVTQVAPVTVSYAGNATLNVALRLAPVPSNSSMPKLSGKARHKKWTTFTGKITPARGSRVTIEVQVLSKKRYKTYTHNHISSNSHGNWTYRIKVKRGTYRIRAITGASEGFLSRTTGWRKVVVK
jgi:hypothetical protein